MSNGLAKWITAIVGILAILLSLFGHATYINAQVSSIQTSLKSVKYEIIALEARTDRDFAMRDTRLTSHEERLLVLDKNLSEIKSSLARIEERLSHIYNGEEK